MNRYIALSFSIFCLINSSSCNGQQKDNKTAANNITRFNEGTDYLVFDRVRIMDRQAFTQPVEAYSILLSKGWQTEGEVFWTAPGQACAGTNMGFRAKSADGKFSFEMLPYYSWSYNTNPQTMQFSQSLGSTQYCSFGQPMDAEQYLRNVFAREL
jgi:hypothetical protein